MKEKIKKSFYEIQNYHPNLSLDEILYQVYQNVKNEGESFDLYRPLILETMQIDEIEFYTKNVDVELKEYIEKEIFPQYEVNDKAHGIVHIMEVIRRSFALNHTFHLNLDPNMVYTIAAYHDLGKHEDHERHHEIAAKIFYDDEHMMEFFTDDQRIIMKEAIEDHRSSKSGKLRSEYGKLVSSADRNTRIDIVFIRSFFVAQERMPEMNIEEYLDYTIKRLLKKYSEENPENMFYEDETYKVFLADMRELLKKEEEFKNKYCEVNHIRSREHRVCDELGELAYTRVFSKKYR